MSESPRLVPDASVILKWVLNPAEEPHHEEALEVLNAWSAEEVTLWVPSLWFYEVGNTLCLKQPDRAEAILASLRRLRLLEVPVSEDLSQETVAIAVAYGVTFYDAVYLAVARLKGATLMTADRRFADRLPDDAPIRLLGAGSG